MSAAETLAEAAADMSRVLDVVDAMHDDSPNYAATLIDSMGIDRTCLASLRLIDVLVHLIADEALGGPAVSIGDITEYIRENIQGVPDVTHTV